MARLPYDIQQAAIDAREQLNLACMKVSGKCHEGSEILYDKLRELGYDPAIVGGYFVKGKKEIDHTWLEVKGAIIDITADQFGKEFPDVWIDAPKEHYRDRFHSFYADNPKRPHRENSSGEYEEEEEKSVRAPVQFDTNNIKSVTDGKVYELWNGIELEFTFDARAVIKTPRKGVGEIYWLESNKKGNGQKAVSVLRKMYKRLTAVNPVVEAEGFWETMLERGLIDEIVIDTEVESLYENNVFEPD